MNGFPNDSQGGGFMADNSSGDNTMQRKPLGEQTLRPVTLKQIKNVSMPQDEVFLLDGADLSHVTFVAVIREIREQSTNTTFSMEDGTASLDVMLWNDSKAGKAADLSKDTYVRVIGRLNYFSNNTKCVAFSIRPVTDFNEISYHMMDVLQNHLKFTRSSSGYRNAHTDTVMGEAFSASGTGSPVNDRVLEVIKKYSDNEDGTAIHQVIHALSGSLSEPEIRKAVGYLIDEGHCYTTVDDDHVKST